MNRNIKQIKELLKGFSKVSGTTKKNKDKWIVIDYYKNPLNPYLLSYCFDYILDFDVEYRIFEKVNYIIEFDYKGTFARVEHYKLDYELHIEKQFKKEIIEIFKRIKLLLSRTFQEFGKIALEKNEFTMENEYFYYHEKFRFYQDRIINLEKRRVIVEKNSKGQCEIINEGKGQKTYIPKNQDKLIEIGNEIIYSIESYIDVFFSFIEHILTLLYPFLDHFDKSKSYKDKIYNSAWTWDKKIEEICENKLDGYIDGLREIKEVYRNRHAHGMFSRELKVYAKIPGWVKYPMFIGKRYLNGFLEDNDDKLTYEKFLKIKKLFNDFLSALDFFFEIPTLFIKSGLPIPLDIHSQIEEIKTIREANYEIDRRWYEIYNQSNMDW